MDLPRTLSFARALARSKSRMTTAFSFGSRALDQVDRGFRQFGRRHLLLPHELRQTKRVALGEQGDEVGCGGRHNQKCPNVGSMT